MEDRHHTITIDGERMSVADAIRMCPVLGEQAIAETVEIVEESLDRQERAAHDASYNEAEEYRRQMADLKASFSVDNLKPANPEPQTKAATEHSSVRQPDKQPRQKTTNKTAAPQESSNTSKANSTTPKTETAVREKASEERVKLQETPPEALFAEITTTAALRQEAEQEKAANTRQPTDKPPAAKVTKPTPRKTSHSSAARKPVTPPAEVITLPTVAAKTPEQITYAPVIPAEAISDTTLTVEAETQETADNLPQLEAVPMSADELLDEFPELADMFGTAEETEYVTAEAAEDELLSDEDLQILAAFQTQLETASPEDFKEADDSELVAIDPHPAGLFNAPPAELQPPTEASPAAIVMVEQITEQIATLEPEISTKAESILDEISHTLQALEQALPAATETDTDADSDVLPAGQIEAAKADLIRQVHQLCETIGLEYSEDEITELIAQLLVQPELTRELANLHSEGAETLMTVDKGTHESLPWFTAFIKHLKYFAQRAAWRYRLLGRRALNTMMTPSPAV